MHIKNRILKNYISDKIKYRILVPLRCNILQYNNNNNNFFFSQPGGWFTTPIQFIINNYYFCNQNVCFYNLYFLNG